MTLKRASRVNPFFLQEAEKQVGIDSVILDGGIHHVKRRGCDTHVGRTFKPDSFKPVLVQVLNRLPSPDVHDQRVGLVSVEMLPAHHGALVPFREFGGAAGDELQGRIELLVIGCQFTIDGALDVAPAGDPFDPEPDRISCQNGADNSLVLR